jgi:hypothetical protein
MEQSYLASQHKNAQWQWGRGIEYALEAGKSLILINGAAAIAILTFVGNHPPKTFGIFRAINMFASGALLGALFFGFAYLAQLNYGNRSFDARSDDLAKRWHWCAYLTAAVSVALLFGECTRRQVACLMDARCRTSINWGKSDLLTSRRFRSRSTLPH